MLLCKLQPKIFNLSKEETQYLEERKKIFLPHLTTFPNDGEACFRNKNLCRNKM